MEAAKLSLKHTIKSSPIHAKNGYDVTSSTITWDALDRGHTEDLRSMVYNVVNRIADREKEVSL